MATVSGEAKDVSARSCVPAGGGRVVENTRSGGPGSPSLVPSPPIVCGHDKSAYLSLRLSLTFEKTVSIKPFVDSMSDALFA